MADQKSLVVRTVDYYHELRMEMRKVSWPNRKQVESTTAVVIVAVFAFAGYFAIVDSLLTRGVHGVLSFFSK